MIIQDKTLHQYNLKLWVGLGGVVLFLLVIAGILLFQLFNQGQQSLAYPSAIILSQQQIKSASNVFVRDIHSYQSKDDFPELLSWYRNRFNLGNEQQALGRCSHYSGESTDLLFTRHTSLTLCDTREGRFIFVQRHTSIR